MKKIAIAFFFFLAVSIGLLQKQYKKQSAVAKTKVEKVQTISAKEVVKVETKEAAKVEMAAAAVPVTEPSPQKNEPKKEEKGFFSFLKEELADIKKMVPKALHMKEKEGPAEASVLTHYEKTFGVPDHETAPHGKYQVFNASQFNDKIPVKPIEPWANLMHETAKVKHH